LLFGSVEDIDMLLKTVFVAGDDSSLAILNFFGFLERKDKVRRCGAGVLILYRGQHRTDVFLVC